MYCDGKTCALVRCKKRREVPDKLDNHKRYWYQEAYKQICYDPIKSEKRLNNGG